MCDLLGAHIGNHRPHCFHQLRQRHTPDSSPESGLFYYRVFPTLSHSEVVTFWSQSHSQSHVTARHYLLSLQQSGDGRHAQCPRGLLPAASLTRKQALIFRPSKVSTCMITDTRIPESAKPLSSVTPCVSASVCIRSRQPCPRANLHARCRCSCSQ